MAYAIEEIPGVTGVSRTRLFAAIRDKKIMARKAGRQTIVEAAEIRRWIQSLPTRGRQPDASAA